MRFSKDVDRAQAMEAWRTWHSYGRYFNEYVGAEQVRGEELVKRILHETDALHPRAGVDPD